MGNREKIAIAGLVFLYYLQKGDLYKESSNQLLSNLKSFQDKKITTPEQLTEFINTITDGSKRFLSDLIHNSELSDTKGIQSFTNLIPSIITLYSVLIPSIVKNKPKASEIVGTTIPMPGDVVSFLKLYFLSLFDSELYNEIMIFIKHLNPSISAQNTIDNIHKYIKDNNIKSEILTLLLPDQSTIDSSVTLDLGIKISLLNQINSIVPPS